MRTRIGAAIARACARGSNARAKFVAKNVFDDIAPHFKDRPGGYTRILRLSNRRLGDAGELAPHDPDLMFSVGDLVDWGYDLVDWEDHWFGPLEVSEPMTVGLMGAGLILVWRARRRVPPGRSAR